MCGGGRDKFQLERVFGIRLCSGATPCVSVGTAFFVCNQVACWYKSAVVRHTKPENANHQLQDKYPDAGCADYLIIYVDFFS